jgi:S-DNA-T family DNA segregation ATPase FtsK/SpoIIIE
VVLLVDGYPTLAGGAAPEVVDDLHRVVTGGPEVGLHSVLTGDRIASIPGAVSALARQRLLFRLADPSEYAAAGLAARPLPDLPPGRAVDTRSGLLLQVAVPAGGIGTAVGELVRRCAPAAGGPPPVEVLPAMVRAPDVAGCSRFRSGSWTIGVGRRDRDLDVATIDVRPGEHVLVAGPARSGKTGVLAALAASAPGPVVLVAGARSRLAAALPSADSFTAAGLGAGVDRARCLVAQHGRCLLLVDDADAVDDDGAALDGVLAAGPAGLVVVAAARPEALRTAYTHWTRTLRRSRLGILLRPAPELDGELLGVHLPRRPPVAMGPGRGYLVQGGDVELLQAATAEIPGTA